MTKIYKFKTDIAFITIKDLTSYDSPDVKFNFFLEDLSGCIYEKDIDISFLQELSPIFRLDPTLFSIIIQSNPTTTFQKDAIILKYEFPILGKIQEINIPIESKTCQSLDSETIH